MSELSCGVVYEIAYIVKLTNGASGWELPITLKLRYPDGREQIRQQSLLEKPRGEWMELSGGTFLTNQEETGEFWFDLCEHGGHWKTGLIIKGLARETWSLIWALEVSGERRGAMAVDGVSWMVDDDNLTDGDNVFCWSGNVWLGRVMVRQWFWAGRVGLHPTDRSPFQVWALGGQKLG
ncbi:hypothetical protein ACLB2K_055508 [Fragaria x ananassa]